MVKNVAMGAISIGIFTLILGFALSLPGLNTFFVDFNDMAIEYVRIIQYGLFFIAFGYIARVIA